MSYWSKNKRSQDDSWSEARQDVLVRDKYTCQECGCREDTRLHVHHLIPRYAGGQDERNNLITLCPACHSRHHLSLQATLGRRIIEDWIHRITKWLDFGKTLPHDMNFGPILRFFGMKKFKPGQLDIIMSAIKGESFLYISPTGSGKSLCFQIPAILKSGYCLVVCPLKSLMVDQVRKLHYLKMPATYINGDVSQREKKERIEMLSKGFWKFLYISPEGVGNKANKSRVKEIKSNKPSFLIIDEAHCIDIWGESFRSDYAKLGELKRNFDDIPVLAFTATAGKDVQNKIIESLGFTRKNMKVFIQNVDRPNISLVNKRIVCDRKRAEYVDKIMKDKIKDGKVMIFVPTIKIGERVAKAFKAINCEIPFYNSKLNALSKDNILNRYIGLCEPKLNAVICTNAFGMGLDIPNIRLVVHWQYPSCIENYVQEYGRAGRDGKSSVALLFVGDDDKDFSVQDYMLKKSIDKIEKELKAGANELSGKDNIHNFDRNKIYNYRIEKLNEMRKYAESKQCLRKQIIEYFGQSDEQRSSILIKILKFVFGEKKEKKQHAQCCSNCRRV